MCINRKVSSEHSLARTRDGPQRPAEERRSCFNRRNESGYSTLAMPEKHHPAYTNMKIRANVIDL